jgi:hypothetical protein
MTKPRVIAVPLDKIKLNPWRDTELFPIDRDHVEELKASIGRHGFFGGIKARERDGFFEIGCGAHRVEAARQAGLASIDISVGDMTDDEMINLMATENGTQHGSNAAAAMNDVAAVTQRLVDILLDPAMGDFREISQKYPGLFEGKQGFEQARGKLLARVADPNKDGGVGRDLVLRYLGGERSPLNEQKVRDAIATLKQSGRYDDIVDQALDASRQKQFQDKPHTPSTHSDIANKPTKPRVSSTNAAPRCSRTIINSTPSARP